MTDVKSFLENVVLNNALIISEFLPPFLWFIFSKAQYFIKIQKGRILDFLNRNGKNQNCR